MDILSFAKAWKWQVIFPFFLCSLGWASGQIHYSIIEESEPGTVVGNFAQDLGLNLGDISKRRLHFGSDGSRRHFVINKANADLTVNERIDRESLCGSSLRCILNYQVITENPLELFNVEIEVLDVNDNAPFFSNTNRILNITEVFTSSGAQFPLEIAKDLDVGINGISQYRLNPNPYFSLSVKNRKDGTLIPQLVLEKALDREEKTEHILTLTAIDGGEQPKSGSSMITVIVLDINDNAPVFHQPIFKISLLENPNLNQVIIVLNATDIDEGPNGEIEYSFDDHTSDSALKLFDINSLTGEIYTKGVVDFEECNFYELSIRAKDKGVPKLEGSCLVQVEVEDENDNPPEIIFTSMSNNIPENAAIETAVGFFTVRDRDSGKNGEVKIEVSPNLPFKVKLFKNHYSLVISASLDREKISQYNIQLTANDLGSPPLHTQYSVIINVSDINDNPPIFSQSHYNAFIKENNEPGSLLCSVSAFDLDEGINTELVYSIVDSQIDGSSVFSLVYINPNSGNIYAQRAFDYEHIQVFQIIVRVEDAGSPKLFSNASVIIFVLDENDNAPTVLYPQYSSDDISQEKIPRSASVGYLVTKISAVDLDSGHNAWLVFRLAEDTDSFVFGVSAYTGEIRTLRSLDDLDTIEQQLVILISDHGEPSLSTTVTILINIVDNIFKETPKSHDFLANSKPTSDLTLYLIVSLVAISLVSLVTFIILLAKCLKRENSCNSGICCSLGRPHSKHQAEQYKPTLYLNTDGTLKYMEVRMVPPEPQGQCYQTCFPPATETHDFAFMKPLNFPQLQNVVNDNDNLSGTTLVNEDVPVPFNNSLYQVVIYIILLAASESMDDIFDFRDKIFLDMKDDNIPHIDTISPDKTSDLMQKIINSIEMNIHTIKHRDIIDRTNLALIVTIVTMVIMKDHGIQDMGTEIIKTGNQGHIIIITLTTIKEFLIIGKKNGNIQEGPIELITLVRTVIITMNNGGPPLIIALMLLEKLKVDCNTYIHAESCHLNTWKENIPVGQCLRIRKNCSRLIDFEQQVEILEERFNSRGYDKEHTRKAIQRATNTERETLLTYKMKTKDTNDEQIKVPFITEYNVDYNLVKRIVKRHWHILKEDNILGEKIPSNPTFIFEKATNLKSILAPNMDLRSISKAWKWQVVYLLLICSWGWVTGQLRYSIVEESEPGSFVGNIAKDLGLKIADLSKRRLHLVSERSSRYFMVKQDNGILSVKERIDRESLCESILSCLLHTEAVLENPLELFSLEIEILDINDNSPTFSTFEHIIKITELLEIPGAQFPLEIAHDPDVGIHGVNQYTLNSNIYFSLSIKHRKDGTLIPQLVLEKVLDREETNAHQLILTAFDGGEPRRSGSCKITVLVVDINDNAPVFDQAIYKINLQENIPLKTVIARLNATDLDEGLNGEIEYSFNDHTLVSAKEIFGLNAETGEIYINDIIDFEKRNFYELSIKAYDKGLPKLERHCLIQVEIEDVNDNPPEITISSMINEIPENAALGTVVGFLSVKDKDAGKNGEVQLQLSPSIPFKFKPFNNRYSLLTDGYLDREKNSQYIITFIASDMGSPPLKTQATIILNVSDINDNCPTFLQTTYSALIKENNEPGALLCTVSASDLDDGINSDMVYSIIESKIDGSSASSFVYINTNNGNIYSQRSFDYEQMQLLQITVKVQDSGVPQLSSNASVFIFVLDTNDNYPTVIYPDHLKEHEVQEKIPISASIGYLLTKISALDLDSGYNAWLLYNLIDASNPTLFRISEYTGEIRTNREIQETDNIEQRLVISISDHGTPSLTTTFTIQVYIVDNIVQEIPKESEFLTNSSPASDVTLYLIVSLVAISLVSLLTFTILIVKCLKKEYNDIQGCCFIKRPHSSQYIDQFKPTLYLNTDGTLKYMEVRMVPSDPQAQCYQTYLPPATEKNDFTFMKQKYFPQLKDETAPEAKCLNELSQIGMELAWSWIGTRLGYLQSLDWMMASDLYMDITSSLKAFKWQVVFLFLCSWGWVYGQLRYSVVEESEPGTLVENLAKDLGLSVLDLNKRHLALGSEKNSRFFAINEKNGALTVKERIDREILCGSSLSCLLHLEVVTENPLELFSLEVEILDINDNSPTFASKSQVLKLIEQVATPAARFPLETAQDPDVGVNSITQYRLNPNPFFSLFINKRKDGIIVPELILEKNLDREEKGEHRLILSAFDGGEKPQSGYTEVTVIVYDINDNAPVFEQSTYKVSVLENIPLNTIIIRLNATDLDEGSNGAIQYGFDHHTIQKAREIFALNSETGEIYVNGNVDFEELHFYELSVRAIDKGIPELNGHCLIHIEVQDANDNTPEIIFTQKNNDIPENAPLGTVVGFITVRDKDSGQNGEIKLQVSPNIPFKCQPFKHRYSLVTNGYLDREKVSQYIIQVTASDLGSPSLHNQTTIILNISDVNDNPPVFLQSDYIALIKENNEPGSLLCAVSAIDPDEGVNSNLIYSIANSQIDGSAISSFVYINSHNGNIYAQRSFDYEQFQVLQVIARVEDSGTPKLFSNASISIFILDTNDNVPAILYPEFSRELNAQEKIPKSASVGYLVTKVSAVDQDSGHNAWLIYSLLESTSNSLFQISASTGEIRTIRDIQEADNNEQRLVILVSDHGMPSLSSTITMHINIVENIALESTESQDLVTHSRSAPDLTLYLIVSLVAISLVSIITFIILFVKCLRSGNYDNSCGVCFLSNSHSKQYAGECQPKLFLNSDGTLKFMEVRMAPTEPQGQCYQACFNSAVEKNDFNFMKPLYFPNLKDLSNETEGASDAKYSFEPNQWKGQHVNIMQTRAELMGQICAPLTERRHKYVKESAFTGVWSYSDSMCTFSWQTAL
ncbi:uncharacterized protein LOC128664825 [Bombina bombina]|uniref:uncharacterized protein LOC128664825 n=1 Tax=Bombina bombina TaxID=8345 RepID=UPI00235AA98B|nr:uncharacterized protein LOC128664825 [Bombina bombina]